MYSKLALHVLLPFLTLLAGSHAFESLNSIPRGWDFLSVADGNTTIKLRISLKQQNLDIFHQKLMEVSTPSHPNYGNHYEGDELRMLLRPAGETTKKATKWLKDHDITSIQDDNEFILFRTNVKTANALLNTTFGWYRNAENGKNFLRTLAYTVPDYVAKHINFVQPTTRFGSMRPMISMSQVIDHGKISDGISKWVDETGAASDSSGVDPACNLTITPQCLQQLYNVQNYEGSPKCGNTVAYASFLEEYARYTDLQTFESVYFPKAKGTNYTVVQFNNGLNNQTDDVDDSAEANLDNQYTLAMGWNTPVTEFSTGGLGLLVPDGDATTQDDNTNEPYLDFFIALSKLKNWQIPNSISISYGENEQEIPEDYALTVCQLIGVLGARGKSVIVAAGDSGVGDWCLSNDGKNSTRFQPIFPASCPYVTSIGGTRYIAPERATYFSSGGFSNYFPAPDYQLPTLAAYKKTLGTQNAGYFNPNGRGFPDVSAQAWNYRVIDQGLDIGLVGTSCATPVFNGIVALLNSERIERGLPTLGFLNPWIYSTNGSGFNDITTGGSTGCNGLNRFNHGPNGSPVIPGAAWNAVKGWDPVTGFGTPDFQKLLKMAVAYKKLGSD